MDMAHTFGLMEENTRVSTKMTKNADSGNINGQMDVNILEHGLKESSTEKEDI